MGYPSFNTGDVLAAADMNAVGLWRITNCTVTSSGGTAATASNGVITIGSGNTSITVASAFSADFDNYMVVLHNAQFSAAGAAVYLQLSGSTGATYYGNMIYNVPGTAAIGGVSSANGLTSGFFVMTCSSTGKQGFRAMIYDPQNSVSAGCTSEYYGRNYNGTASAYDTNTSASTGFKLEPGSGTMTGGTLRVYGIRD